MNQLFTSLTHSLQQMGPLAYIAIGLIAFSESLLIISYFLPGVLLLVFAGFLCSLKIYHPAVMFLAAWLGHFLGEIANYYLGRQGGRPFFQAHHRRLNLDLLAQVERRFSQGAFRLMLIGQFVGLIRPVVSFTAGMIHFPFAYFVAFKFPLSLLWVGVNLGAGYLLGAGWEQAPRYLQWISLAAILLGLLLTLFKWLRGRYLPPSRRDD